jgi:hypothetical protein
MSDTHVSYMCITLYIYQLSLITFIYLFWISDYSMLHRVVQGLSGKGQITNENETHPCQFLTTFNCLTLILYYVSHHQWFCSPCKDTGRLTPEVHNLLWHLIGLIWTSDQPVAKASTYTGKHNIETQRKTSMPPRAGFEPTVPVTKRPRPMP